MSWWFIWVYVLLLAMLQLILRKGIPSREVCCAARLLLISTGKWKKNYLAFTMHLNFFHGGLIQKRWESFFLLCYKKYWVISSPTEVGFFLFCLFSAFFFFCFSPLFLFESCLCTQTSALSGYHMLLFFPAIIQFPVVILIEILD